MVEEKRTKPADDLRGDETQRSISFDLFLCLKKCVKILVVKTKRVMSERRRGSK